MSAERRILYIDDDAGLCRLATRSLARRGYRVDIATDGATGVAMAAAERYDAITVDHYMPGMDGVATLEALRAQPEPAPVVYVTGSEESRVAVAALKAGADDYVVKTLGEDFFDLLDTALSQAIDRRALSLAKAVAEAELRESNARLETLLREVNHRVANSLQLVSAFVHLQSAALTDQAAKEALTDTQRRIEAIAKVHRRLYTGSALDMVAMDDYLHALVEELEQTWSTPSAPRQLKLASDPIRMTTDRAVSLGVIVNELVSNACKYAYAGGSGGEVRIALLREGEAHFRLVVEDDGCGMAPGATPRGTGIGTRVIGAMAKSLHGELSIDPGHSGVRAVLTAAL
ncbi:sensor histidine kinase [Sphingomonas morindae]|uniref:histidine kinase n=1 Tax=Sphingomonas morindae TaxID=1541170 RepID=A0ABY4XAH0_9SPHN|nr:response regulator [Sphingomonas morindae]USI73963.1 response regulator [Sphingomonas morindae]